MKIRTKLQVITLLAFGLAVFLIGSVNLWTWQKVDNAIDKSQINNQITKDVFELNVITGEYLLHHGRRAQTQWQLKYDSLTAKLGNIKAGGDSERIILERILGDLGDLERQFNQLVESAQTREPGVEATGVSTELEQRLAGQLSVKMQSVASDASQLAKLSLATADRTRGQGTVLIGVSGVIIAILVAVSIYFISNSVVRSIRKLRDGTQIVATGDLRHRVDISSRDEIGQLASSFNDMAHYLSDSYEALRRESREHIETAEELRVLNVTLEQRVVERTQELSRINSALETENSERVRAEEELTRSNAELEQFAYVASHDLQEPLRKINAFGDRLVTTSGEVLGEKGLDYLERMQDAARRMGTLINDLLEFSRVTTKGQPFTPVDLTQVVREVLSDLQISIEQSGGRVEISNLPEIDADRLQMNQLLQNLIGNGLKYRRDDVAPVIKVYGGFANGNEGDFCQINVEDNGIGFDEKFLDRIFTLFQRLHGRGDYEGTGIGLAVCRKIVQRHGGSVTAKSTPGQGSRFMVTLPTKQSEVEKVEAM